MIWIGFITILFFAPLFWPFWPPFGETVFNEGTPEEYTVFHQNNFNFTGPLIVLAAARDLGRTGSSPAASGSRVRRCRDTPEELRAIERELDALEHGAL